MDNFTFRQYLKESGYDKMTYQEEVYTTCLGLGNYQNIDLYYQDEIDEAYEQNVPVNELAAKLCAQYDKDYGTPKPEEIPEFEEEEYSQETLDAMADYPQDEFNEATETEETFEDWKGHPHVVSMQLCATQQNGAASGQRKTMQTEWILEIQRCRLVYQSGR